VLQPPSRVLRWAVHPGMVGLWVDPMTRAVGCVGGGRRVKKARCQGSSVLDPLQVGATGVYL
jgi:hypothetical protein